MPKIRILSPEVRGKIAAGEVISRPSSVIKELVENSLDAQAKRVEIDITDGGKQKCLVNDDGIGMIRDDALLAIERYSTSKIGTIDDIEDINTYGFRGEALASIAQVSYFELETSDGEKGTKIEVRGGEVKGVFDSHRPRGTRIKISNLFFNLPVRFKFLKSSQWERRLITEIVKTYAFVNPEVHFSLGESERNILDFLSTDSIEKRIKMFFPRNIIESLINIDTNIGKIKIFGFFSHPEFFERHHMNYIYVNSRPVRYPRIYRTIINTYQNPKNPPAFILNIIVEPKFVDINIHPAKNEVKFRDEKYIIDLLTQIIKKKIFSRAAVVDYKPQESAIKTPGIKRAGKFIQETVMPYEPEKGAKEVTTKDSDEFWQLHNTFILSQTRSGLIIVDQHVAHERIIYESIMKGRSGAQRLLFPITLELTPEQYRVYKKTRSILKELGIEFKEFSSRTIVIDSLPANAQVNREDITGLFGEINELGNLMKEKSEIAKVVACRSAIKAGQKLSIIEMQNLIDGLFACENPYTCPHGRPIVIKYTLDELASRFGR